MAVDGHIQTHTQKHIYIYTHVHTSRFITTLTAYLGLCPIQIKPQSRGRRAFERAADRLKLVTEEEIKTHCLGVYYHAYVSSHKVGF